MSLHLPCRRLIRSATARRCPTTPLSVLIPSIQCRNFWWGNKKTGLEGNIDTAAAARKNLNDEFLRKRPERLPPTPGNLADSSIFEDEAIAGPNPLKEAVKRQAIKTGEVKQRNFVSMQAALDPDPKNRKRWERKMVIQEIHKRGRLTRIQVLKRTEKVVLSKSHDFKTSVKKLMPLARQIAGKTVEEALIQMRFSKKKVSTDVLEHLKHARNEAIVRRGMGLGLEEGKDFTPLQIQTKDKKRITVRDPTTIYIDQAWVGKGQYGRTPDYRARGQVFVMKNPSTSISLVLKEEKTRIRKHEERVRKAENKKVWVQLPNRPISAQRQFYSW